ncbi:MAG: hypothetical protein RBT05_08275 [Bacteroidales bacterium]|jgi:hypothetical protein|nr:hypothetical protein [Bacteroidales bacterium]
MSDPIFKIAKDGQDALTTNQKDLVFDIDNDYMIILEERTDTSDGSGNLEITHGLGYIPAFYHYYESSAGVWERPLESGLGGAWADSNKIYIDTPDPNTRVRTVIWANSQDNSVGSGRNNASGKLKIAKAGYDAKTETDLRRFKFASGGGVLKIKEKKTITVSTTGDGSFSQSYNHGLGYVPQVYVFMGGMQIPAFFFVAAGMSIGFSYTVDDEKITCHVFTSLGEPATDYDFNAQILLDKID